jgi:DNA-binding CsgD family transcriptional regulator
VIPVQSLFGREEEQVRISAMLTEATVDGRSSILLIEGEPGIGKTVLLDWVAGQVDGDRVLRVVGAESEMDLPFGAVRRLLRRTEGDQAGRHRPSSRVAELIVKVTDPSQRQDRFTLGADLLEALGLLALDGPLVFLVDDAHWLDGPSLDALAFVARRLEYESVCMFFAARAGETPRSLRGLPMMRLGGLDRAASRALMSAHGGDCLSPRVMEAVLSQSDGHPLALMEMPQYLNQRGLANTVPWHEPLPVGERVQNLYYDQIHRLPSECRTALLVAALAGTDRHYLSLALGVLGLSMETLGPAEDAGLIAITSKGVAFKHPLVRSATVALGSPRAVREGHRSLAEALAGAGGTVEETRRLWHLSSSLLTPDDAVADAMHCLASQAASEGAFSSASYAYERSADLTPGSTRRLERVLAAARTAYLGGDSKRATELLGGDDFPGSVHTEAILLRGEIDTWTGRLKKAHKELKDAARAESNPTAAAHFLLGAVYAMGLAGDTSEMISTANETLTLCRDDPIASSIARFSLGTGQIMAGNARSGRPLLDVDPELIDVAVTSPASIPFVTGLAFAHLMMDEHQEARALLDRVLSAGRSQGFVSSLPFALGARSVLHSRWGELSAAKAAVYQALELSEITGQVGDLAHSHVCATYILAVTGPEAECRKHGYEALRMASQTESASLEAVALASLGTLELGLGNPAAALSHLTACRQTCYQNGLLELGHYQWAAEYVEACSLLGEGAGVVDAIERLESHANATNRPIVLAFLARARGIFDCGDYSDHFNEALAAHSRSDRPIETARTELCYGERLRRARRISEARDHLNNALNTFQKHGASNWIARTQRELNATGLRTHAKEKVHIELTPQELMVAQAVSKGATNREVGAELFLSVKTVEHHLSAVYRKLGVRSRTELVNAMTKMSPA